MEKQAKYHLTKTYHFGKLLPVILTTTTKDDHPAKPDLSNVLISKLQAMY